ncbi:aldo/keto reductase [Acidothermaceae bacterium B102]|nr:aldo/keto reductase [Acidothermaceae bacterium B102]
METRQLGRTHHVVGVVGLGAWQIGADWGTVDEDEALAVIGAAVDAGVTLIDTADVYGDGRSERLIGRYLHEHPGHGLTVATKLGRRVSPVLANFTAANLRAWTARSQDNLGVDTLDLVQLHCPETAVYSDDAVFDALDELVADKTIGAYGVSVETCAEALTAIARPGVASVQIVFNALRQKPLDEVLPAAAAAGVAIIARVPLASGLLSGKYDEHTQFAADDHRNYNRQGQAFDKGETFAGVPYDVGLAAVHELKGVVPAGETIAQLALRWIIDQPGVTVVIPGARNVAQAESNAAAASAAPLTDDQLSAVRDVYDRLVRPHVHHLW